MYTDEDLQKAVEKGIFSAAALTQFREDFEQGKHTIQADEEDFKLISSFNDIFVVVACLLILISVGLLLGSYNKTIAALMLAVLSWGLAEFFVRKRQMALPAIVLFISFEANVFAFIVMLMLDAEIDSTPFESFVLVLPALGAAVSAWLHWKRYRVPIAVAVGIAMAVLAIIMLLLVLFSALHDYAEHLMFISGLLIFYIALRWDGADLQRVTRKSDVAFWLHLTAAPLIVHPVFFNLGVSEGNPDLLSSAVIVGLYALLSVISLVLDRRAFMVSALLYVLITLTKVLETYGLTDSSLAYVSAVIGSLLLLLSGFWQIARRRLLPLLPVCVRVKVPSAG